MDAVPIFKAGSFYAALRFELGEVLQQVAERLEFQEEGSVV